MHGAQLGVRACEEGLQAQIQAWRASLGLSGFPGLQGTFEKCHRDGSPPQGAAGGVAGTGCDWGAAAGARGQCREGLRCGGLIRAGFLEQVGCCQSRKHKARVECDQERDGAEAVRCIKSECAA